VLSAACFGLVPLLLWVLKWGRYTQLIPYPVVGGFLAGVGLMMLIATLQFLVGTTVPVDNIPQFLSWEMTVRWLPALIGAGLLYWGINRIKSVLLLPIGLICILVLFY